jgi:hypothetical protein
VLVAPHALVVHVALVDLLAHVDLRGPVDALVHGEKDAKLAQKLGQLQPFVPVFPPEYMGQLDQDDVIAPNNTRACARPRRLPKTWGARVFKLLCGTHSLCTASMQARGAVRGNQAAGALTVRKPSAGVGSVAGSTEAL